MFGGLAHGQHFRMGQRIRGSFAFVVAAANNRARFVHHKRADWNIAVLTRFPRQTQRLLHTFAPIRALRGDSPMFQTHILYPRGVRRNDAR
ncbi:hypothetical protein BMAGN_1525 [Bifidobacterium magnum]|uniref:Uncharacterized protein n=1 Tax=Bifidobacterium magnum TaxID=1692 RepID=A0A087B9W8_9BIFI|nr:hypothetical protein BMAGN_1525 [Bifidobacterium magnum]